MKHLYPLSGVVAIPQTPFDDADRIDLDGLSRAVADRLAAGVDGLLYPVVASEVGRLSTEERRTAT
ncbi:MAG TPA: dihydrodipicolinate synthase family protein, partial [Candidatus Deferrimicrobium sp.]|nr:dihydrodipicolinate synthase family protein [Candidatus Deferrimicrobium sp.]